jgi:23S rRNA pseudouridine1911/1915/1917 synthase
MYVYRQVRRQWQPLARISALSLVRISANAGDSRKSKASAFMTIEPCIITVPPEEAGARLDKFLSCHLPDISRERVQALLKEGCVTKAGVNVTQASAKVKASERYCVTLPLPTSLQLVPENLPLDIVYEDAHLLVINKAAGMVVHPAAGVQTGTLVNALLHHCKGNLSGIGGVSRPGIVHRLDKDTSGLMLVAKTDAAHQHLSKQLQDRTLSRTYHAFVWGVPRPANGMIDAPIGRSPTHRKKMAIVAQGRHAVTHYRTLETYLTLPTPQTPAIAYASKVECTLETGRTHQIRVHLSEQGCGLIGDTTYGASTAKRMAGLSSLLEQDARAALTAFPRQALHALRIAFIHPAKGEEMRCTSHYPEDMKQLERAVCLTTH